MEQANEQKTAMIQMNPEEKKNFDKMMLDIQSKMIEVRMESVRMSREAEKVSSMAFLNC